MKCYDFYLDHCGQYIYAENVNEAIKKAKEMGIYETHTLVEVRDKSSNGSILWSIWNGSLEEEIP